jgi:hypothetical protein
MQRPLAHRLPALLIASAATSALAAAPALATEGPGAPGTTLPVGVAPITFAPLPSTTAPLPNRARPGIRRARLVPRRVRSGRRPLLKVSLTTPGRLQIVVSRRANGHRVALLKVRTHGSARTLRLPARSRGHALRPGRYSVNVVAFDAQGQRSRAVRLTLIVRHR